jgi:myo-inositol-1-phosphate synthase
VTQRNVIAPANGKLGILFVGLGAVATTTIAGVLLARRGLGKPIGSLTQLGTLRVGKRGAERPPLLKDAVPLASLDALEFGGWDIFPDDALSAATNAGVIEARHLEPIREDLAAIAPMQGVYDERFLPRLRGVHVKKATTKLAAVEQVREDIRRFKSERGVDRVVVVWTGSTETFQTASEVHRDISSFEKGLANNDPNISPTQIYAWACLKESVAFANGAPNLGVDFTAASLLARETGSPVAGKDFKTGQTLVKTILAPGLKARMLGLRGWYSTNMLGNRDGEVLDEPEAFKTKETSKLGVLETILEPKVNPDLYGDLVHKVRIDYYPPRGDAKEGWDNIDLVGWLGYPMQMKINFLCRDSILAAPVVLDLALLLDLARRAERSGTQDWLGFYFKSPMAQPGMSAEHDLFAQLMRLKSTLRAMIGAEPIATVGEEHYD